MGKKEKKTAVNEAQKTLSFSISGTEHLQAPAGLNLTTRGGIKH